MRLPVLLLTLFVSLFAAATTRVYPPEALPDMEQQDAATFRSTWPGRQIADGGYPPQNGIWVTYQHENLTYFVGPYASTEAGAEGKAMFERIRAALVSADPKFHSSKVGLLELDIDWELLEPGSPPPGMQGTLDGVVELKAEPPEAPGSPPPPSTASNPPPTPSPSVPAEETATASEPTAESSESRQGEEREAASAEGPQQASETESPSTFTQHGGGFVQADAAAYEAIPTAFVPFFGHPLPSAYDLRDRFPPVGDQEMQNSCVGWTIGYALKSYQEARSEGWSLRSFFGRVNPHHSFSPSYIYNQINGRVDKGASLLDGLLLANTNGVCRLSSMPYNRFDYRSSPSPSAVHEAKRFRIETFRRIGGSDLIDLKAFLRAGFPVAAGILADPSFEELRGTATWSRVDRSRASGHALTAVGYDDRRKAVLVYNSWGTKWGDKGLGWIDYALWPQVVEEAYILKDGPNHSAFVPPAIAEFSVTVRKAVAAGDFVFEGTVDVPEDYEGKLQVEVQLLSPEGQVVRGLLPDFRTVHGQAATVSRPRHLGGGSRRVSWDARMPADAIVPPGTNTLHAVPILFMDRFGLLRGDAVPIIN